jgi:hypothetical protein
MRRSDKNDLTGRRFGKLVALRVETRKEFRLSGRRPWICKCDCGNEVPSLGKDLTSGRRISCGCYRRLSPGARGKQNTTTHGDLTGQVFERLTVMGRSEERGRDGRTFWVCKCTCGGERLAHANNLLRGGTKSCGCLQKETRVTANTTHGHHPTGRCSREYQSWGAMMDRCYNPARKSYQSYGAKGVTVDLRWHTFENFLADMGKRPPGTSLDRMKGGNYGPGLCRWATPTEQARNRAGLHPITLNGRTQLLVDWAAEVGLSTSCICTRLSKGWSEERAVFTPSGAIGNDKYKRMWEARRARELNIRE